MRAAVAVERWAVPAAKWVLAVLGGRRSPLRRLRSHLHPEARSHHLHLTLRSHLAHPVQHQRLRTPRTATLSQAAATPGLPESMGDRPLGAAAVQPPPSTHWSVPSLAAIAPWIAAPRLAHARSQQPGAPTESRLGGLPSSTARRLHAAPTLRLRGHHHWEVERSEKTCSWVSMERFPQPPSYNERWRTAKPCFTGLSAMAFERSKARLSGSDP
jgi:hypothetical protein